MGYYISLVDGSRVVGSVSDLTQRVITAAALIPLMVWGVLGLPTAYVALIFASIVLCGAWEWGALAGWKQIHQRVAYTLSFVPILFVVYWVSTQPSGLLVILLLGLSWWVLAGIIVVRFQREEPALSMRGTFKLTVVGWLILAPAWIALVALHGMGEIGPYLVMFLMGLVWSADIGAYFVGKRWGRTRLASRVSPGKSLEGVAGALIVVGLVALPSGEILGVDGGQQVEFVLLCLATVVISILGDLTESLVKRKAGVKDSGGLLPGHGGVLDRIDSLTAAAPFFALGLIQLGMVV